MEPALRCQAAALATDGTTPVASTNTARIPSRHCNPSATLARNGDSRTLTVIRELRRYRRGHLGVADEVAGLTVYGNFPVHDTDRVLRMLASALPIRIEQPLPWWTRVEARR